jgi:glutamate/aspartate transport system substrate-binding protein
VLLKEDQGMTLAWSKWVGVVLVTMLGAQTAMAEPSDPTWARIDQSGRINVGIRESAPPFSEFVNNNPRGYSVDICARLVASIERRLKHKVTAEFVPVNSKSREELLRNGKIDMECGTTTDTVKREQEFAFAYPFFVTGVRMAKRQGDSLSDYADLNGKKVAVVAGATAKTLLAQRKDVLATSGIVFTIVEVATNDAGVQAVVSGAADGFVADDVLLAGAISAAKLDKKLVRTGSFLSVEPYAVMLRKADTALLNALDAGMVELTTSGETNQLVKKWFGSVNGYTINSATREAWAWPVKHPAWP